MMDALDYSELDPGIRDLVKELREKYGMDTCDSGDGVSKPESDRVFHERHVFVQTTEEAMHRDTKRLALNYPGAWVELSWAPGQVPNILILPDGITPPEGYGPIPFGDE